MIAAHLLPAAIFLTLFCLGFILGWAAAIVLFGPGGKEGSDQ